MNADEIARERRIRRARRARERAGQLDSADIHNLGAHSGFVTLPTDLSLESCRYMCAHCGVEHTEERGLCGGCKCVKYCSRDCQTAAWKEVHKFTCHKTTQWPTTIDFFHLHQQEDGGRRTVYALLEWGCGMPIVATLLHTRVVDALRELRGEADWKKLYTRTAKFLAERLNAFLNGTEGADPTALVHHDRDMCAWLRIAADMSGLPDVEADYVIGATPLPEALVRCLLRDVPLMHRADVVTPRGDRMSLEARKVHMTRLLAGVQNTVSIGELYTDDAVKTARCTRVADVCVQAIIDQMREGPYKRTCTSSGMSPLDELVGILRNITFAGVRPTDLVLLATAFRAHSTGGLSDFHYTFEAHQRWYNLACNLPGRCCVDCPDLHEAMQELVRAERARTPALFADGGPLAHSRGFTDPPIFGPIGGGLGVDVASELADATSNTYLNAFTQRLHERTRGGTTSGHPRRAPVA